MPEETIETISIKKETKKVEKSRWEKGWDTRTHNKIAAQQKQLDQSISSAAHNQWMTKKDKEIADLKQQLAEQKSKKKQSRK